MLRAYLIPGGDAGTFATVARMREEAQRAALHPLVRQTAARIVLGVPGAEGTTQAKLLRAWVAERTVFLADPSHAEFLQSPPWVLQAILTQGIVQLDCDDVALLTAALGVSVGLLARFVIVGFRSPAAPYQHVWCDLADPRQRVWVPVDPTRPAQPMAQHQITRRYVVEV